MLLRDILPILDAIAPLAGDPAADVSRALVAIDYTADVAEEARREKCELVIAYHPPLFEPVKRLGAESLVYQAIRDGIALYSPHTALDVAKGGTNDFLADTLGLTERTPLKLTQTKDAHYKLIAFVPESDLERVSAAIFEAGAGRIGNYSSCSFRSPGTGTFLGEEGTNPTVGQAGKLEQAPELRIETILPIGKLEAVIAALLAAPPEGVGIGRFGSFEKPVERAAIIERIKKGLGVASLLVSGPAEGSITRAAVCAGAGGSLLDDALGKRAELYLTGEVRHHDALKAASRGMTVVCALHSNSERAALSRYKERLEREASGVRVTQSAADRDPFTLC
jgi:dinuclear metal center YbgI/SA1388 family protein